MKFLVHYKKMNSIALAISFVFISFIGCGGGSSTGGDEIIVPENLVVTVTPVGMDESNPYGDGSGIVNITMSAKNATSYRVNFGDNEIIETSSTSLSYTYTGSGVQSFTIFVSAYNGNSFISTSVQFSLKINTSLKWSDEFNGTGAPNSANWTHEIGNGNNGWGNGEFQYYTASLTNSKMENGVLKITAKAENKEGFKYTSARLISKDKFDFKYGRIDVRAKLPSGSGTWPAIWLLGADIETVGWPACGEIDIMEHWGHIPTEVSSATHTPECHGGCENVRVGATTIDDYSTAFHTYSLEWDENELRFLIDDEFKYKYAPSNKNNDNWPFNKPHFIILNIAMGSSWHSVDPNFTESTMEIDFIRVY